VDVAFPPPPPFADAGWTTPSAKMNVAMNANLKKAVMVASVYINTCHKPAYATPL
jgi:hypothetical protein